MGGREIYIGQYKKGTRLIKFNIIRYTTFCLVLDYYCYMNILIGDNENNREWLTQYVLEQSSIRDNKKNRTIIDTAITNMIMIGLLYEEEGNIVVTNKGKQAYIDQTYHMTAANLYEAKEARRLSNIAIFISILSICIAIFFSVLNVCCHSS